MKLVRFAYRNKAHYYGILKDNLIQGLKENPSRQSQPLKISLRMAKPTTWKRLNCWRRVSLPKLSVWASITALMRRK